MISLGSGNPTALKVGQEGVIFGHHGTVVGRSVLRSRDGYRWNEYHLKLAKGKDTTLVYESGIWKRFALFDPDTKLSADGAADLGVGDAIYLGGCDATVSYVGESRVTFIEGEAPEGYRVGSEAHYFNAEAGGRMFVVSWTGDEVEFYEGENLPRGEVERAFGLPEPSLRSAIFSGGSGGLSGWLDGGNRLVGTILIGCALFAFVFFDSAGGRIPTIEPLPPVSAPTLRFPDNAQGDLAGHHYTIVGHQVNEIAETRGTFGRHEYDLVDEQGGHALLVQGLSWSMREWFLLGPPVDPISVQPSQAAAAMPGYIFSTEHIKATIHALYRCRTIALDGEAPATLRAGTVRYGFTAQTKDDWILARWDEAEIEFDEGRLVSESEVRQAFGPGISK
jgi:hypothetical protein